MPIVHRHQRRTASGKTVNVRQHHRDTGDGDLRPAREDLPPPPVVGGAVLSAGDPAPPDESWWDGDGEVENAPWLAEEEPQPEPGAALRGAGYEGPLDQDGNPTSRWALFRALVHAEKEQDGAQERFCYAPTVTERDAAERDYQAAKARFDALAAAMQAMGWRRRGR